MMLCVRERAKRSRGRGRGKRRGRAKAEKTKQTNIGLEIELLKPERKTDVKDGKRTTVLFPETTTRLEGWSVRLSYVLGRAPSSKYKKESPLSLNLSLLHPRSSTYLSPFFRFSSLIPFLFENVVSSAYDDDYNFNVDLTYSTYSHSLTFLRY